MSKKRQKKKQQKTDARNRNRQKPAIKSQSNQEPLTEIQIGELERKLDENLQKSAYQNAVKCARKLHNIDHSKYQAVFVKALRGHYQELSRKQQNKKAVAIMEQIKALAEPGATDFFELQTALANGTVGSQQIDAAAAGILKFSAENFSENNKNIIIETLLAATDFPKIQTDDSAIKQLLDDICAIRLAFALISDKDYEDALKETGAIRHKSPLAPWRLLIKGICAYYTGDDEKALTAFKKLPENSSPAQFAKAYLFLLKDRECVAENGKNETFLKNAVKLATSNQDIARLLPRAEILWKTGRFRNSLEKIRPVFKNYSSAGSTEQKRLLRFYCNSIFEFNPDQADKYLVKIADCFMSSNLSLAPNLLQVAFFRIAALVEEEMFKLTDEPVENWDMYMELLSKIIKMKPNFKAAIIAYQASIYNSEDVDYKRDLSRFFQNCSGESCKSDRLSAEEQAEELYLKALNIDPDNLEINLQLLNLYNNSGSRAKSKANRLLDKLIAKFPDNKEILFQAGAKCVERKAYVKGLKYLQQASALAPSDKKIRKLIIIYSILYAWNLAKKNNEKWRKLFTETLPIYCVAEICDLNLSPGTLHARRAAFELYSEQFDESKKQLTLAQNADRSLPPETINYFFWLYVNVKQLQNKLKKGYDKQIKTIFKNCKDIDIAIIFADTLLYNNKVSQRVTGFISKEIVRINKLFNKLKNNANTPKQCLAIVNFLLAPINKNNKLALTYLKQAHKQFPDNFTILLKKISVEIEVNSSSSTRLVKKVSELEELIARARSDPKNQTIIIKEAEELIATCDMYIDNIHDCDFESFITSDVMKQFMEEMLNGRTVNQKEDDYNDDDYDDDNEYFEPLPLPPGARKPPKNWPRRRRKE